MLADTCAGCHRANDHLVFEHVDPGDAVDAAMRTILTRLDGLMLIPPVSDCDRVLEALKHRRMPHVRVAPR